ncbi:MAG: alternative ribosome rescue aminoacyl-tRNA hydrolase ArfB [Spirochaetia bacterium]|nr:aminoacyl-tRNA hydrolase [Spirochaetales bacterium]
MAVIPITPEIALDERELRFEFIRASGPGGQKVNKSSTAVQLRFDVLRSPSLPEEVRSRLIGIAGRRLSEEGILVIEAKRFRSQDQNRQDAVGRLTALVRQAAQKPRRRRRTRPSAAARERRVREKKQRSAVKQQRRRRDFHDEM